MAAAGITSGCGTNQYCPNAAVTRGEMASFLDRAYDLPPTGNDYFSRRRDLDPRERHQPAAQGEHHRRLHADALLPDGLDDAGRDGGLPAPRRGRLMRARRPSGGGRESPRSCQWWRSAPSSALRPGSSRPVPAARCCPTCRWHRSDGKSGARRLPDPVGQRASPAAVHGDVRQRRRRPLRGVRQPRQHRGADDGVPGHLPGHGARAANRQLCAPVNAVEDDSDRCRGQVRRRRPCPLARAGDDALRPVGRPGHVPRREDWLLLPRQRPVLQSTSPATAAAIYHGSWCSTNPNIAQQPDGDQHRHGATSTSGTSPGSGSTSPACPRAPIPSAPRSIHTGSSRRRTRRTSAPTRS